MQVDKQRFERLTTIKANFDEIYTAPDPREYLRVLFGLNYVIPELAKGVFRSLVANCGHEDGRPTKILDLGCSYGINAALIRLPLDLRRLAERYASPEMHDLSASRLVALDRQYFASWPQLTDATVIGQDVSAPAVNYARSVGLIDHGITQNLESENLDAATSRLLADVDIVMSTGCVGYIGRDTFRRVLATRNGAPPPWVASFVLRMYPYEEIAAELSASGLVTEKLDGVTFVQRRFHSRDEFEATNDALRARGMDPAGKEAEGLLHAELYLSRPAQSVRDLPLADLVSVTRGGELDFGRRFVATTGGPPMLVH